MKIAVTAATGCETKASELAKTLSLPYVSIDNCDYDYVLTQSTDHLALCQTEGQFKPLVIDFPEGKAKHRQHIADGLQHPLAKAVGVKMNHKPRVIDATAGLGDDAYLLASLGCSVLMLERNPIIAALLQDALLRLDDLSIDLQLKAIDASSYLLQLLEDEYPDVIIYDPMFPPARKSAKVKKSMQILHDLIGQDEDTEAVFTTALSTAKKRVVVKRPNHTSALGDIKPSHAIKTKNHRFDVYTQT